MDENELQEYSEFTGIVESVIFSNEDNGYSVVRVRDGSDISVTLVGCLPLISPGEKLEARGVWDEHPVYGTQFKADYARRVMPSTESEIFSFLSSGAVKGIGPAIAAMLVNAFGEKTLDIIERSPDKLTIVKGISKKRAEAICSVFKNQMELKRLLNYLCSFGIRPIVAVKMFKYYGTGALNKVRENPYIIVGEYIGGTFVEADTIALESGIELFSEYRMSAAVIFTLKHNSLNGHCFLPREKLVYAVSGLIEADPDRIDENLGKMIAAGDIINESIAGCDAIYLKSFHEAESCIAATLCRKAAGTPKAPADIETKIETIEKANGIEYTDIQKTAISMSVSREVLLITGGPGTGKTTIINAVLALFRQMRLRTVLAAPTGRAAKRMTALTGHDAVTIHRLLEARLDEDHSKTAFNRNENNPLDCEVLIVDESSMLDVNLMHALLKALPGKTRLILVGDSNQLPSVGPGNVFSALVRSGCMPLVKLNTIFRQKAGSSIVKNAHLVNEGLIPDFSDTSGDMFRLSRKEVDAAAVTIVDLVSRRLPEKMKFAPDEIQVLSPTRKGPAGTVNLNRLLQESLNPPSPDKAEKQRGDRIFRVGDKVMQIRNNYDVCWTEEGSELPGSGIFNGDCGIVREINNEMQSLLISFDGKLAQYSFEDMDELEHAWAITVHKSQGSEYPAVVFALSDTSPRLLTREIFYTGITRAKRLLVLVGTDDTAKKMIENNKGSRRYSALRVRVRSLCGVND